MTAYLYSANTGFLWQELCFIDRIYRTAMNDFHAVEFHDEAQSADRPALKDALDETKLAVISLNVRRGETVGCSAIPGREDEAMRDIAAAIEVAEDIGARAIHVLSGIVSGSAARKTYLKHLQFALNSTDLTIFIEPICSEQIPGYFLNSVDQAHAILLELDHPHLKIMFDCFHVHRQTGAVLENFRNVADRIGHVQIAAAEDRAEPIPGLLDYSVLLPAFIRAGYTGSFGCEYRPRTTTDAGLGWQLLV